MSLKDFAPKDWERVVLAHINQHKWFPKICELREELVRLRSFNRPSAEDVWHGLIRTAENNGSPPDDEHTQRALRVCGGWDGFLRLTYKDLNYLRRDFVNVYNHSIHEDDRTLRIGQDILRPQIEYREED